MTAVQQQGVELARVSLLYQDYSVSYSRSLASIHTTRATAEGGAGHPTARVH